MRLTFTILLSFLTILTGLANVPAPAPFQFVANAGQWPSQVQFATAVPGGHLFLENNQFTYNLQALPAEYSESTDSGAKSVQGHAFRMQLVGAQMKPKTQGQERQSTYHNYFLGSDPKKWATKVPLFAAVRYEQVYAGVDMVWHSVDGQLKYDYEVASGADPSQIRMRYEGLDKMELHDGQLQLHTQLGVQAEQAPIAYQVLASGERRPVACRFRLYDKEVRFELTEKYDTKLPLIIDPALVFSTYTTKSTFLSANSAAGDEYGNMYTAGYSQDATYPVTVGAYQSQQRGQNMGISKLDPTGRTVLFATYLGGNSIEYPLDLTITAKNELIVLALSGSTNYPVTGAAYDKTFNGGQDYVISRLSADGSALLASTYLGGSGYEGGSLSSKPATVTSTSTGDVLIGGNTNSLNFPVRNALQPALKSSSGSGSQFGNDGFVARLNEELSMLQWSTYLGGTAEDQVHDIKVAPDGSIYVCGQTASADFQVGSTGLNRTYRGGQLDGFLLHLSATGNTLLGGTFLGTTATDLARFIDFDSDGQVLVAGATAGSYPVTDGAFTLQTLNTEKVFIHCFNPGLTSTSFSTQISTANSGFIGSSTLITAFNLDACNRIYFCAYGSTSVSPVTSDGFSSAQRSIYLAVLSPEARRLEYGTYFGGPANGGTHLHPAASNEITKQGVLYHIECTTATNFTTTPGTYAPTKTISFNSGAAFKFNMLPTGASLPTLTAALPPVPAGCAPYTVQFSNAGSGAETYEWDFGDGSPLETAATPAHRFERPGSYQVRLTVTRTGGCGPQRLTTTTTVGVTSPASPLVSAVSAVAAGCAPYTVQFQNTSTSTGPVRYEWNFGDGSPLETGIAPQHRYTVPGRYLVRLTAEQGSPCGTQRSISETLVVVDPPAPMLIAAFQAPAVTCAAAPVEFVSTGLGATRYQWNFGDGSPLETSEKPLHRFSRAGTYQVQLTVGLTNVCGDKQEITRRSIVVQDPPALVEHLDSLDCRAQLTLDAGIASNKYEWSTGETTRSIIVKAAGIYRVNVTTSAPCPTTVAFTIKPAGERNIFNVITPNGDRRNDTFVLPSELGIPELRIFNRWGREVYQSAAYRNEWQAEGQPAGIYYYQVRQPQCALTLKGWVEVIR
ncbi:PKD domain containing protein [Hymenobacter roseosalivarius DSM 11622]|uniref:PKD domain containing protein n=1 Tax=Hymenobacter roseosalivarius DSM 11622 TaxID=645990 RepID=A0A1W1V635_9BACT|nr:PKD domain-containing protein [Hymenobacter roseosalivarius]SMB88725.1 PKD domain containing protein [Hymenobacter roseosalivarius DSM 11622]